MTAPTDEPSVVAATSDLGEPLLTVGQVARFLGVHRATVYRLATRADGIRCVQVAGVLRFRPEAVREYLARRTVAVQAEGRVERLLGPPP